MIADTLKDINWSDVILPPEIRPYLFGALWGSVLIFVVIKVLIYMGLPRKTAKFLVDLIDTIKVFFKRF